MYDEYSFFQRYCWTFERIVDGGEEFDRVEAFELIDEILNQPFATQDQGKMQMAQALSSSAMALEVTREGWHEWRKTAEYLVDSGDVELGKVWIRYCELASATAAEEEWSHE